MRFTLCKRYVMLDLRQTIVLVVMLLVSLTERQAMVLEEMGVVFELTT